MTTSNNTTANKINENVKANIIALGVMAIILGLGLIFGLQLENSFYLTSTY